MPDQTSAAQSVLDSRPENNREVNIFTAHLAILDFIDNDMKNLSSMAELRAALVIWRKTHGWGKMTDAITSSQLVALTGSDRGGIRRARKTLTEKVGISIDQELDDAGDLARTRYTWPINARVRATLEKSAKAKEEGGVGNAPTGGVRFAPTQSCNYQSCKEVPPVGFSSAVSVSVERQADTQPTNRKTSDSPPILESWAKKPNQQTPKADPPSGGRLDNREEKTISIETGKQFWTAEELQAVRTAASTLMGHEPRQGFEMSCQLRACGEPASSVILLLRGLDGKPATPAKWENYLLKCIGTAFSATERDHLPEPPAKPRPEHRATVEEINRGIDVLDTLVASCQCPGCDGMIQQFQNRVVHVLDGRETDSCPGRLRKSAEHARRVSRSSIARAMAGSNNDNSFSLIR
jgi:hypothetical protein